MRFGVSGVELTIEQTPEESSDWDQGEACMDAAEAGGFRCRDLPFRVSGAGI